MDMAFGCLIWPQVWDYEDGTLLGSSSNVMHEEDVTGPDAGMRRRALPLHPPIHQAGTCIGRVRFAGPRPMFKKQ